MPTVHHVLEALEDIAPTRYAFDFDRVGLQVGEQQQEVKKAIVSLDRSLAAVDFATSMARNSSLLIIRLSFDRLTK